jgi:hypothetical protein
LGNSFKLFSKPVANGSFTNINLPSLTAGLAWQNNLSVDGSITVVTGSVTQPTLGFSQSGNQLTMTWTDSTYHLQAQTNTVNVGVSTNWVNYPGGTTSPVMVNINLNNGAVFFRLSQ